MHNSVSSGSNIVSSQPVSASSSSSSSLSGGDKQPPKSSSAGGPGVVQTPTSLGSGAISSSTDMNGLLRAASAPQPGLPRSVFPASTGPGPPPPSPGPPASPAAATAQGSAAKPEQSKVGVSGGVVIANSGAVGVSAGHNSGNAGQDDHRTNSTSPPPNKKSKINDPKVRMN